MKTAVVEVITSVLVPLYCDPAGRLPQLVVGLAHNVEVVGGRVFLDMICVVGKSYIVVSVVVASMREGAVVEDRGHAGIVVVRMDVAGLVAEADVVVYVVMFVEVVKMVLLVAGEEVVGQCHPEGGLVMVAQQEAALAVVLVVAYSRDMEGVDTGIGKIVVVPSVESHQNFVTDFCFQMVSNHFTYTRMPIVPVCCSITIIGIVTSGCGSSICGRWSATRSPCTTLRLRSKGRRGDRHLSGVERWSILQHTCGNAW